MKLLEVGACVVAFLLLAYIVGQLAVGWLGN